MTRVPAAARGAAIAVAVLLLGAVLVLLVTGELRRDRSSGIGLSRLLEEEEIWRGELRRQGRSINEADLWEVQEEVAWRSEISREGVKGLTRRAANARDPAFKAEGLLLGGNLEAAAGLNLRLAEQYAKQRDPAEIARLYRRAADAEWRGDFGDPVAHYRKSVQVLGNQEPRLRADLWMDLALLHWARANFHPEDPHAELTAGLAAVSLSLQLRAEDDTAELRAAKWLQGCFLLRLAIKAHPSTHNTELENAEAVLRDAAEVEGLPQDDEFTARIQHALGLCLLTSGQLAEAVAAFDHALSVRTGRIGGGKVDVRVTERRLTERAESLAARALAGARLAQSQSQSDGADSVLSDARAALELTLPDDPGTAWIMAKTAELIVSKVRLRLPALSAEERAKWQAMAGKAAQEAVAHYPAELADRPGVPSLDAIRFMAR